MRVVFFGTPAAALPSLRHLLEAGHAVELVVTQPDRPAGRGRRLAPSPVKQFALERGIPVLEPEKIRKDASILPRLEALRPDIQVVVAYGQIIPGPVIYLPPHRTLNVHFSLLPKYRGAAPVQRALLNGDAETGVTIIELNEKMDEGPILAEWRTPVGMGETAPELESRLAESGAHLLLETLSNIDTIVPRPQDHAQASLAPKVKPEDGHIDWSRTAAEVDRIVRALAERPGAYTSLGGRRILIHRGHAAGSKAPGRGAGEVVAVTKEGLSVACGNASVYLVEELQPEGKRRMPAHTFSLGTRIGPGAFFDRD
jgi:methionyl-tRNA formyltransferase